MKKIVLYIFIFSSIILLLFATNGYAALKCEVYRGEFPDCNSNSPYVTADCGFVKINEYWNPRGYTAERTGCDTTVSVAWYEFWWSFTSDSIKCQRVNTVVGDNCTQASCPENSLWSPLAVSCVEKGSRAACNDFEIVGCGFDPALDKDNEQENAGNPCPGEGNPCNPATGNKYQLEIDYIGRNLVFQRSYNSNYPVLNTAGRQWQHNFTYKLDLISATIIELYRPDGKKLRFFLENIEWRSGNDTVEELTQLSDGWEFKTASDTIEKYDLNGQLQSITTRIGLKTTFTYSADTGLLKSITSPFGRTLDFAYDPSGRLITLTTPEATQIHYAYDDATQNLVSVTYPDSTSKTYHYENTSFPNHLTGITDENGIRYATWAYDNNGLTILTEHANGAEKVQLVYNTDETTTVTDALGRVKTYTFETHYGMRKSKTIEYSYSDGKQDVIKTKTYTYYPENGRVKEVTDYNGSTTYYEYNNRGLITLETWAKGQPEEYNIATTWHPDYRLPATRTYPDQTETYTYVNGQLTRTDISTIP